MRNKIKWTWCEYIHIYGAWSLSYNCWISSYTTRCFIKITVLCFEFYSIFSYWLSSFIRSQRPLYDNICMRVSSCYWTKLVWLLIGKSLYCRYGRIGTITMLILSSVLKRISGILSETSWVIVRASNWSWSLSDKRSPSICSLIPLDFIASNYILASIIASQRIPKNMNLMIQSVWSPINCSRWSFWFSLYCHSACIR